MMCELLYFIDFQENGSLKREWINKFFRMGERGGLGEIMGVNDNELIDLYSINLQAKYLRSQS